MAIKIVTYAEQIGICLSLHTIVFLLLLFLVNVNSNRKTIIPQKEREEKKYLELSEKCVAWKSSGASGPSRYL